MKKVETKSEKVNDLKQIPEVEMPTLDQLLKAGSHFGHRSSTWNPKMKEYIYTQRNGVHIIDLIKTMTCLKTALKTIQEAGNIGNILIVGTKGQAATMVQQMALQKGAFYVNKRWPGGLFTNFRAVKKSIDKIVKMEQSLANGAEDLVKKEELMMKKEVERLNQIYEGIKFMDKLPALIVVIDSKVEKNAIREANNANIPIVALVDTNCDPSKVKYPIPANDDSLKSISLFIELFSKALDSSRYAKELTTLRTNHATSLESARMSYEAEQARIKAMEEEERMRMKALRTGGEEITNKPVIRLVSHKESASIKDSKLNTRAKNVLEKAGYKTIDEVSKLSLEQLAQIKGISQAGAKEILNLIK